jgi:hypothetical protein
MPRQTGGPSVCRGGFLRYLEISSVAIKFRYEDIRGSGVNKMMLFQSGNTSFSQVE